MSGLAAVGSGGAVAPGQRLQTQHFYVSKLYVKYSASTQSFSWLYATLQPGVHNISTGPTVIPTDGTWEVVPGNSPTQGYTNFAFKIDQGGNVQVKFPPVEVEDDLDTTTGRPHQAFAYQYPTPTTEAQGIGEIPAPPRRTLLRRLLG